mmetsp:Transcript_28263/g.32379  ORF Transcript_28263/g.32379 Transcript_28263/m.32379 type:complete len:325 (+) Transcript_28263:88-1062(+)
MASDGIFASQSRSTGRSSLQSLFHSLPDELENHQFQSQGEEEEDDDTDWQVMNIERRHTMQANSKLPIIPSDSSGKAVKTYLRRSSTSSTSTSSTKSSPSSVISISSSTRSSSMIYCSCSASLIQKEIDNLYESTKIALQDSCDEIATLNERHTTQQEKIVKTIEDLENYSRRQDRLESKYQLLKKQVWRKKQKLRGEVIKQIPSYSTKSTSKKPLDRRVFPLATRSNKGGLDFSCHSTRSFGLGAIDERSTRSHSASKLLSPSSNHCFGENSTRASVIDQEYEALNLKLEARNKEILSLESLMSTNVKELQKVQVQLDLKEDK